MSISLSVVHNFGPQIRKLSKATGFAVMPVFREELRFGLEQAQRFVPPTKGGNKTDNKSKYTTLRNQGNRTMRRDLNNVAKRAHYQQTKIPKLAQAIQQGRVDVVQNIVDKLPANHSWHKRTVIDGKTFRSLHRRLQNRRGRVRSDQNNLVIDSASRDERQGKLASGIGIAKASFTPALNALGSKKARAKYISRHGNQFGSYHEIGVAEGKPQILVSLNGFKRPIGEMQAIVNDAFRRRQRALNTKVARALNNKIVKMGNLGTFIGR